MQNTYHFLKHLTSALDEPLTGASLEVCFTQSKDELILGFTKDNKDFYIKAHLRNFLTCLAFSEEYYRAKRNSTDLFKNAISCVVIKIVQHHFERSFHLELSGNKQLLFKMHGTRANIILFENGKATELFHHSMPNDLALQLKTLSKNYDLSFENFNLLKGDLKLFIPTFDKQILHYFEKSGYNELNIVGRWDLFGKLYLEIESGKFYICKTSAGPAFTLFKSDDCYIESSDPIQICNAYLAEFGNYYHFNDERNAILKTIAKRLAQLNKYIEQNTAKYFEISESPSPDTLANVIMANLHAIPEKALTVNLYNFYTDKEEEFTFKPMTTPQKLAEQLYRKAKNRKKELSKLQENIDSKTLLMQKFETLKTELLLLENLKAIRHFANEHGFSEAVKEKVAKEPESMFKTYTVEGFKILVGRNAKNNDLLTKDYAHKDDLWLHAKDVSGSHVVIKQQPGKNFPKSVIEFAATIAAWNSKRRTDSLCPVTVTPKKYVRKPKGLAAGQVRVEKEDVILVVPKEYREA
jgi:predicted ribosome quality control (RQC) complex YloA/Tae2 family protein